MCAPPMIGIGRWSDLLKSGEGWTSSAYHDIRLQAPGWCKLMYPLRVNYQIIDFALCWACLTVGLLGKLLANLGDSGFWSDTLSDNFLRVFSFYFRAILFPRALMYVIDFGNAHEILGEAPLWLQLHHVGCFFFHAWACWTLPIQLDDFVDCCLGLILLQASSNTWTKRVSKTLYWANSIAGFLALFYVLMCHPLARDAVWKIYLGHAILMLVGCGICLLACDALRKSSK